MGRFHFIVRGRFSRLPFMKSEAGDPSWQQSQPQPVAASRARSRTGSSASRATPPQAETPGSRAAHAARAISEQARPPTRPLSLCVLLDLRVRLLFIRVHPWLFPVGEGSRQNVDNRCGANAVIRAAPAGQHSSPRPVR